MRVLVIGAGPSGLVAAKVLKEANPNYEVSYPGVSHLTFEAFIVIVHIDIYFKPYSAHPSFSFSLGLSTPALLSIFFLVDHFFSVFFSV